MKHSDATVDRALTMLIFGTNANDVSKFMQEEFNVSVNRTTIIKWRDRDYVERYSALHEKYKEQIENDAIRRMRERLRLVDQAEMLAVSRVITDLEQFKLSGKDAAQAALAMSRVKAQNVEKLMQLTGRPTQIIEDRSGSITDGVLRELIGTGVLKVSNTSSNGSQLPEEAEDNG